MSLGALALRVRAIPALDVLKLRQAVAVEDRIQACRLLLREVAQQLDGHTTQRNDCAEVDQNHRGGEGVGQGPDQRDGTDGAAEDTEDNSTRKVFSFALDLVKYSTFA